MIEAEECVEFLRELAREHRVLASYRKTGGGEKPYYPIYATIAQELERAARIIESRLEAT